MLLAPWFECGSGSSWCCKRAKLAPARCGLLPPQPGDDQNRRLARVVGQLGQAVSPYTLRKYGAPWVCWRARFSSDSDGSNAIEERRVGFRVRRVVYPVGRTSRHRLPPPVGPITATTSPRRTRRSMPRRASILWRSRVVSPPDVLGVDDSVKGRVNRAPGRR
jgi:hypothetical protein